MSFTVYKSSAGSGKTYTLVKEYLRLVLGNTGNYRHVLAITFTNKAANEMKERIIKVLKLISQHDPAREDPGSMDGLLKDLMEDTGLDIREIVANAGRVLDNIIHNYSEFAVSTIDSFVHRVIKSFAFDLNIPVNFEVEIDTDEVLKQVIDVMISRAGSDGDLTRFLVDFVQSRADEDKNWNIEADLLKVARILKKEDSMEHLQRNAGLELRDYIRINGSINKFMTRFEQDVQSLGKKGLELINSRGISPAAFHNGDRGIVGYFRFLAGKRFDKLTPNSLVVKALAEDKWVSGKASDADKAGILAIKDDLTEVYQQVLSLLDDDHEDYILFREIRKTLYPLAILDKINQILEEFKSENNLLLISEFNQLIAEIVLDEPVPFIYERVGEKYRHFLLDEFQDTSVLQWQNLMPLLDNSLANGHDNLVVGDAKQAIYRWRNGEVEQFVSLPGIFNRREGQVHLEREMALQQHYQGRELKFNFRSRPGIVDFNNRFFRYVSRLLPENEAKIYEEVHQTPATSKEGGFVQIEFFPPAEDEVAFDDFNCNRVKELIEEVRDSGYRNEDVAILCRTNNSAGLVAEFLLNNNIQVVSSESMLLQNSPKVRLIICVLTLLLNPGDKVATVECIDLMLRLGKIGGDLHREASGFLRKEPGQDEEDAGRGFFEFLATKGYEVSRKAHLSIPLFDLCESLIRILGLGGKTDPFIQFFLDVVLEQEKESQSGIRKFLEFWSRKKTSLSIVVPEGLDAVKVMTVHKAKGLEFPIVIYPFVKDLLKKTLDSAWIDLDNPKIPTLKTALVTANKAIQESSYGALVTRELEKSQLDLVNLLYVTFTRPTDELYVIANHPQNLRGAAGSVPELLMNYLKESEAWSEEMTKFRFGSRVSPGAPPGKPGGNFQLENFVSSDWRRRALVSFQAPANWEVEEPETRQEWGNLIHKILSEIRIRSDLSHVLDQYLYEGFINNMERQTLSGIIHEFLSRPEVEPFFRPGLTVLTEKEIISPGGGLFRPDRIVIKNDGVYVIDFKTGRPVESHRKQVLEYMNVMQLMEYAPVKGGLFYVGQTDPVVWVQ